MNKAARKQQREQLRQQARAAFAQGQRQQPAQPQAEPYMAKISWMRQHGPNVHPQSVTIRDEMGNMDVRIYGGLAKVELTASELFVEMWSKDPKSDPEEAKKTAAACIEASFAFWEQFGITYAQKAEEQARRAAEEQAKREEEERNKLVVPPTDIILPPGVR